MMQQLKELGAIELRNRKILIKDLDMIRDNIIVYQHPRKFDLAGCFLFFSDNIQWKLTFF